MSWKATALVKPLTHHQDGTKLTAREKLILFVLADSHNEERGNCAWISVPKAAKASLTSERRFSVLLQRLAQKGSIRIQRRDGQTNLYFFPALEPPLELRGSGGTPPLQLQHPTPATATAPKPLMNRQVADIPPVNGGFCPADHYEEALQEYRKTGVPVDAILARMRKEAVSQR